MGFGTEVGPSVPTLAAESAPAAFLRHSVRYAVARLGLTALDVVLLPFYARSLSPDDFGRVSVATSLFAILAIVYTLGFDGALQPLFFRNPARSLQQRAVVTGCVTAIVVGGLLCALGFTALGPEAFGELLRGVADSFFRLVVWAAFLNIFLNAWLQLLQLRQRSNTYLWISLATAGLRVAATVAAPVVRSRDARSGSAGRPGIRAYAGLGRCACPARRLFAETVDLVAAARAAAADVSTEGRVGRPCFEVALE